MLRVVKLEFVHKSNIIERQIIKYDSNTIHSKDLFKIPEFKEFYNSNKSNEFFINIRITILESQFYSESDLDCILEASNKDVLVLDVFKVVKERESNIYQGTILYVIAFVVLFWFLCRLLITGDLSSIINRVVSQILNL